MTDYSIKRFHKYSDNELIEQLRTYAKTLGVSFVSCEGFSKATGIAETTITNHFDSWRAFCERAQLAPRYQRSVSRTELFENLDRIWRTLAHQPRSKEMKQPLSPISISRYQKEFKKPWYDTCLEFLSWKSGASVEEIERDAHALTVTPTNQTSHTTRRAIPLSLRYEVLKLHKFRCVKCGRSPASHVGVELHIDHKTSWASGGETLLENLQCSCSDCNYGKSDRHDE